MFSKNVIAHTIRKFISLLLVFSLCTGLLYGCTRKVDHPPENSSPARPPADALQKSPEELFDILINDLFVDIITSDSITMNYFCADPSRFGIADMTPTFGEVTSQDTIVRDRQDNQDVRERLADFVYGELRYDQQVIYDILLHDIELYGLMDAQDEYSYYLGVVRPLNGIQVQLPVILAEFNFYTVADIEVYLQLLQDVQRFFGDLIVFERERSKRGFFLSDANVDKVVEHCESFLDDPENNLMIVVFNDRIDRYEGLAAEQREQYKERNKELVLDCVLPAYETLMSAMQKMRGSGVNKGGLAGLPDGIEFARSYLQYCTGSGLTPGQMDSMLEERMDDTFSEMWEVLDKDPRLTEAFYSDAASNIRSDTPENYLAALEAAIADDFPAMGATRYVVREVHESMQKHVSPAFYLTPAFDAYDDNVIYINPSSISDNLSLFTTLAHEGYPGHMYQNVYYLQQSPSPLRTVLGDWGYTEGWATYVEFQSFYYAGLDKNEAELLRLSSMLDLLLITRIDLGVNALGWDINRLASFCRQLGITDREVVEDLFNTVTGNPFLYLPYCMGYLEIVSLRDEAMNFLGDDFSLIEFNRFLLDFGPAPFTVIRDYMQSWIETQSSGALAPAA